MNRFFFFSFFFFVAFSAAAFTKLPITYNTAMKTSACSDYCAGQSISTSTGFNFKGKGWQLCNCPIGQGSHYWQGTGCYNQCVSRCTSLRGNCANPKTTNTDYKGLCCTTANVNTTINTDCFTSANAACTSTGMG
ncbi:unnamed protein product, partial [Mesorhabditis belari]|uniref:Uncharacterized protein n=1 Tax=Mesorhabditis belari TaxID=2138241 RepID=A0AAF3F2N7_9BILA